MTALTQLLPPAVVLERGPRPVGEVPTVFTHLACPKRRALIRAVGYDSVSERSLKASYGPSWGAVQSDLRALVSAGLIEITTSGAAVYLSLDLGSFPERTLRGLLRVPAGGRLAFAA